eukprot:10762_1
MALAYAPFALVLLNLFSYRILVHSSPNGAYYTCDPAVIQSDNECVFILTDDAPWNTTLKNSYNRSVGAAFYRTVWNAHTNDIWNVTPKPWTDGDQLIKTTEKVECDAWNYVLAFELMAPLRNTLMYTPSDVINDVSQWNKLTKPLVDCSIKTEDETHEGTGLNGATVTVTIYSTESIYEVISDPSSYGQGGGPTPSGDIHNFVLQYLEEGTIDLVCLMTNLNMSRCDTIRERIGGQYCDCWMEAYEAMYGEAPQTDMNFTECGANTTTTTSTTATTQETTDESTHVFTTVGDEQSSMKENTCVIASLIAILFANFV